MPKLTIDATEAKSFEPIPNDTYDVVIQNVGDPTQGPKSTYVNVEFEIEDGDYAGRKLWRIFPINGPGATFIVDLANKALGEEFEAGGEFDLDTDDLLGKRVRVVTEQEEYNGEIRSNVKRILAPAA